MSLKSLILTRVIFNRLGKNMGSYKNAWMETRDYVARLCHEVDATIEVDLDIQDSTIVVGRRFFMSPGHGHLNLSPEGLWSCCIWDIKYNDTILGEECRLPPAASLDIAIQRVLALMQPE